MMRTVEFLICAEMENQSGMIRWLGSEHQQNYPHWTAKEYAFVFQTYEAATIYYTNGFGYPYGLYKPVPGTVLIIERVTEKTVSEAATRLC